MIIDPKKYPDIQRVLSKAIGPVRNDMVEIKNFHGPMQLVSSWSGGSKYYYTLINLVNYSTMVIPECGQIGQMGAIEFKELPVNYCLIETLSLDSKKGLTRIYMNPANAGKYLPEKQIELTPEEASFFKDYRSLKSSARPKNETLKKSLQDKGLIDSRGAVTIAGRNWGKGF